MALTPDDYVKRLPADRREAIVKKRKLVLKHLPDGYEEGIASGMLSYAIPLSRYPKTYNRQPLVYTGLAAQKNYNALYLMGCYLDSAHQKKLEDACKKAGRRLDMGKSCLRFASYEELPAHVLGEMIAEITPEKMIAIYEKSRGGKG